MDQDIVPGNVTLSNMPGGGHGVAFAHTVSKRNGDFGLLIAASTATVARLAQNGYPGLDASMVKWAATMGAEPGVIAVRKESKYKPLTDLVDAMTEVPGSVTFAGGSPQGGDDSLRVRW